ncbi:MAG: exo-alpha-sialidase, partial [Planctomycetia bacterium]|nr:exo-alpha-sialidase [Planctomycetia bacterium]
VLDGEFIVGWYNNPKHELQGKTFQRARRSTDFWNWSELEIIQDTGNEKGLMYVGLQFLTLDGKLYCFTNQEKGSERPTQCLLQVWKPEEKKWEILGPIADKFLSMQAPILLENGNFIISGSLMPPTRDINGTTPVVFISQGKEIQKPWRMVRLDPKTDYVNVFAETAITEDGENILAVTRLEHSPFPNFYESRDFGETWRKIENRTFAASSSKFAAGTFSNGYRYIIYNLPDFQRDENGKIFVKRNTEGNPTTEGIGMGRGTLVMALARPGEKAFSKIWKVSDVTASTQQKASHYPCVLEHDGMIYIVYTGQHGLRNCGLTRFPLKSIE